MYIQYRTQCPSHVHILCSCILKCNRFTITILSNINVLNCQFQKAQKLVDIALTQIITESQTYT